MTTAAGIWLHKDDEGGGHWVLRVTIHGRRREMGLGLIGDVSLKEAREAAWCCLDRHFTG
jgi:hypothetical protein